MIQPGSLCRIISNPTYMLVQEHNMKYVITHDDLVLIIRNEAPMMMIETMYAIVTAKSKDPLFGIVRIDDLVEID